MLITRDSAAMGMTLSVLVRILSLGIVRRYVGAFLRHRS
jgi:hypothetical protein